MEPLLSIRPSLHGRVCKVADGGDEVRAAPLPRVHAHEVRHDLLQTHGDPQQELLHMLTDLSKLTFGRYLGLCFAGMTFVYVLAIGVI